MISLIESCSKKQHRLTMSDDCMWTMLNDDFNHTDLEKVFTVPRTLNLAFSNVPQTIKFGSKVRRNNEKFHRALRVSV